MGGPDTLEQTAARHGASLTEVALLGALTAASLVPFLGKPLHLDDPVFVWTAQQILASPLDFNGFDINWHGFSDSVANANKNPPLTSFYLAAVGGLFGFGEVALHLAMLLPAVAAVLGTRALAKRLCAHPALAAVVMLAMPAFLVSATTLMADVILVACWVWSVFLWWSGLEDAKPVRLVGSALLAGLAVLTKFTGLAIVPLLVAVTWFHAHRVDRRWLAFGLPLGAFGLYLAYVDQRYGVDLREAVAGYAMDSRSRAGAGFVESFAIGALFAGGSFASVIAYAPFLGSARRAAAGWAVACLGGVGLGALAGVPIGANLGTLHAMAFGAGGLALAALLAIEARHGPRPQAALLILWIGGIAVFAGAVNWTINARSLLPAAPAVAILLVRAVERAGVLRPEGWRAFLPAAACLAVSLLVAKGDAALATEARDAARALAASEARSEGQLWFEGAWGFQFYMEEAGVPKVDAAASLLRAGDRVVVPLNNTNQWIPPLAVADLVEEQRRTTGTSVATQSRSHGAGFYSDRYGPLPFVLGVEPIEVYQVYALKQTVKLRGSPRE